MSQDLTRSGENYGANLTSETKLIAQDKTITWICEMRSSFWAATRAVNELLEKNISVLFSQPGESPTLFQPGGDNKNFSAEEERFCLTKKKEGENEALCSAEDERKFPRKSRNEKLCNCNFYLPGGECPQNRYFKEQLSLTALAATHRRLNNFTPFCLLLRTLVL